MDVSADLAITRVCHACVLIELNGTRVLTDPWFTERSGYHRGEPLAMSVGSSRGSTRC